MSTTLTQQVQRYVSYRRSLGHPYVEQARILMDYTAHAEAQGDRFVCSNTVLDWAPRTSSLQRAQRRLRRVCDLADFLHAEDGRHEVPDRDALGKAAYQRPTPRILSLAEVRQIMDAALALPPAGSITPLTFHYVIGLIAVTGLRASEATNLLLSDLTADGLLIRDTKFGKCRLVPLDDSVRQALETYLRERMRIGGSDDHLFVLSTRHGMHPCHLSRIFTKLARQLGLRGGPGEPGTRLHDLRHGFAVRALESFLSTNRRDVGRHALALATYLGHSEISGTYWYLESTPVLLRGISKATEGMHEGGQDDD